MAASRSGRMLDLGSLTFMSLTALRRMHARWSLGPRHGAASLFWSAAPVAEQDQFSQEFQLQSSEASRIRWVAGLYYIHLDEQLRPDRLPLRRQLFGPARRPHRADPVRTRQRLVLRRLWPGRPCRSAKDHALTLGLRYTIEHRSVEANGEQLFDNAPFVRPIPGLPLLTEAPLRNSDTFRELTWRASLDRHFSDEVMGYVSASRGFQSGGWNLQTPQTPPSARKRLDDFEGGLKFADRSRRFRADASVFYYDYSDLQVSAFTPIGSATTNAASAEIYGLELQLDAQLGADTDVTFGGAVAATRGSSAFPTRPAPISAPARSSPIAPMTCDVTGNRLPFAPKLKFNVGASTQVSAGQQRHLGAERKPRLQFRLFRGTRQCRAAGAFATVDVSAEWRPGASGLRSAYGCSTSPTPITPIPWRPFRRSASSIIRLRRDALASRSAIRSSGICGLGLPKDCR